MESTYAITARYYDRLYSMMALDDLPFYLELAARQGGPVLELGAGTGRVTLPLARAGHAVTALDLNPCMLNQLGDKLAAEPGETAARVTLASGDMTSFELDREFSLILTPFRSFQHLTQASQQRACLDRVARHLAPGGVFVLDVFFPNFLYMADKVRLQGAFTPDLEYTDQASGRRLRRSHNYKADFARQVNTVVFRYETFDSTGTLLRTEEDVIHMRWMTRWEAQHLLERCGFEVVAAYGGYDKRSIEADPQEMVFVCRKREA
jgi:SAM-dependent methyltransferase